MTNIHLVLSEHICKCGHARHNHYLDNNIYNPLDCFVMKNGKKCKCEFYKEVRK